LLFVPGIRPDRFAKAAASGADIVVIDLEDAVAARDKLTAREAALDFVESDATSGATIALRLNPVTTLAGLEDLVAIARAGTVVPLVLLPKVQAAAELDVAAAALPNARFVPLIETLVGLEAAATIAAHPACAALMLGGADLSADLGVPVSAAGLATPRALLALAARRHRRDIIDVPHLQLGDPEGLAAACASVKALGYTAKACIHPEQVAAVNAAFAPSADEIAAARAAIAALPDGGVGRHAGAMIEEPMLRRHRRVLALAAHFGLEG
jgi:citrate lyase beta subunit